MRAIITGALLVFHETLGRGLRYKIEILITSDLSEPVFLETQKSIFLCCKAVFCVRKIYFNKNLVFKNLVLLIFFIPRLLFPGSAH